MRVSSILVGVAVFLVCSPVVSGDAATEEVAQEHLKQAEEKLAEAHAEVGTLENEIRSQTVAEREEGPKGNLRGSKNLGRAASQPVTPPPVVDEEEAELAEEQAKEALAKNEFEEAVTEMAKFFEFKELRAAGMRERSNELDKEQKKQENKEGRATP